MKKNHFLEQARLYGLIGLITLIAVLIFYIAVLNSYPLTNTEENYIKIIFVFLFTLAIYCCLKFSILFILKIFLRK